MPGPFPAASPTISGANITVSTFLQNPARVQKSMEQMTYQRFIADLLFSQGPPATGGAVIYDQVLENDVFLSRDVQEIEPGAEFPILNDADKNPLVAIARKYGGEVMITFEQARRDRRDVLGREMTRLRNTIVRKVDTVAMAVLAAAPINTMAASGDWSTAATDILKDVAAASNLVTSKDMGYEPDIVIVNPAQELDLISDKDIRDALPRERSDVPIATGKLGRLLGMDFVVTNRVAAGTVFVGQRKIVGSISDEIPLYTRPLTDERAETYYLHGARLVVPYVTDPKAFTKVTGA